MRRTTKDEQLNAFTVGREKAIAMGGEIWDMIRNELQMKMGNISKQAFHNRIVGNVVHTQFEREGIEAVFRKYNILEVWGKA